LTAAPYGWLSLCGDWRVGGGSVLYGAGSGGLLMGALWLAWHAYSWLGTTVDLDEGGVRITMLVIMGGVMIAALAAPDAFGEHAVIFAVT